jgi:hypothetical protein
MKAADVVSIGDLAEWLAERGLKMKPRKGRAADALHIIELRKAGQPHVARALVAGTGPQWIQAVMDALYQYENKEAKRG